MRDVHGAALSLARAGGAASIFGPQFAQRHALGEVIVETPIDRDEVIILFQRGAHGGGNDLLPAWRIIGCRDPTRLDHRCETVAALPDRTRTRLNSSH